MTPLSLFIRSVWLPHHGHPAARPEAARGEARLCRALHWWRHGNCHVRGSFVAESDNVQQVTGGDMDMTTEINVNS